MYPIVAFDYKESKVRTLVKDGKPWFNGKDVALALGYSNTNRAIRTHVRAKHIKTHEELIENQKELSPYQNGIDPRSLYISEPGVYSLVMRSQLESAEEFQDWVTDVVLPSLRETGSYAIDQPAPKPGLSLEQLLDLAEYGANASLKAGVDPAMTQQLILSGIQHVYPESVPLLSPLVQAISESNPLQGKTFTVTEIKDMVKRALPDIKLSARKVNLKLLEQGYQSVVTRVKSTGEEVIDYYVPTEKGKPFCLLQRRLYSETKSGQAGTKNQLKWFESIVPILVSAFDDGN